MSEGKHANAEAQEFEYLSELLHQLAAHRRWALDVGAHVGTVSVELLSYGFSVVAVEANPRVVDVLRANLDEGIATGRATVVQCGASDKNGTGTLFLGRVDTVSTFEKDWTSRAFPALFEEAEGTAVEMRRLCDIIADVGIDTPGFVKIDVEGHEANAIRGLLAGTGAGTKSIPVIMFEANQRFPEKARDCLQLLIEAGYERFDILVKAGNSLLAGQHFCGNDLPDCWREYGNKYFYANIIAYHKDHAEVCGIPDMDEFLERHFQSEARDVLGKLLGRERRSWFRAHKQWERARGRIRKLIQTQDFRCFLGHPDCRMMFFRSGWADAQEYELSKLQESHWGREKLLKVVEPEVGAPEKDAGKCRLSANVLGMLYYLLRCRTMCQGQLPKDVLEIGGGYGAFAYLYCSEVQDCSYTIVDLPEMLALQYYFLRQALPDFDVKLSLVWPSAATRGSITLIPSFLLQEAMPRRIDLLFSTFGFSEMPGKQQRKFVNVDFCGAKYVFMAGQLEAEAPEVGWERPGGLFASIAGRFNRLLLERFHIGANYLLQAWR